MECTKIILSAYPKLDKVVKSIEKCINERCFSSFHDSRDVFTIFSEVADLFERKEKLIELKRKTDLVISLLSDDEIDLLNCKFFCKKPKKPFSFTIRTYFRRQKKLLEKLDEYFSYIGISDEKFFNDFKNDRFILCCKIKSEDTKRIACAFYDNEKSARFLKGDAMENVVSEKAELNRIFGERKRNVAV